MLLLLLYALDLIVFVVKFDKQKLELLGIRGL